MRKNQVLLFIPLGILINLAGTCINTALSLPLFLDSIGTILVAAILGPWLGAFTGFTAMLIIGIIENPVALPFGLVNAVIGLITGYISLRRGFSTPKTALICVIALSAVCPLLGTVIAVYLFGGVTGGDIDALLMLLLQSGHSIFSGAFLVRLAATLADKLISVFLVLLTVRLMPLSLSGYAFRRMAAHRS